VTSAARSAVVGAHRFAADLVADALHLVFVRSTVPHARLARVDVEVAVAAPGVVAVFRAEDLPMVPIWEIHLIPDGFAQPPLADGVVRYVGERIAAVVARTRAEALDAAETVVVEYEPLPAVTSVEAAVADGTPLLFPGLGTNVALAWPMGDGAPLADGPSPTSADGVVVQSSFTVPRLSASPLEGHSIVAVPEADGRLTVHVSTQVPHGAQIQIARGVGVPLEDVRVVVPRVGGGFGGKGQGGIADHVVTAAAARRLGRPVRFVEDRAANLVTMQGRGVRFDAELRARPDGTVTGLRVADLCDAGAYPTTGAVEPGKTHLISCGPYRLDDVDFTARSVVTNLAPTGAYRGPGRSESAMVLERSLDLLARELAVDPLALRRANLLRPDELPRATPTGAHLDDGDYHRVLDALEATSGYDRWRAEQCRRRAEGAGPLLGLGLATVVDSSAWFSRTESASVRVGPDGVVTLEAATASAGQQQAVAYATVIAEVLGVAPEAVVVVEGDTDRIPLGGGSVGSRSIQIAGSALRRAAEEVRAEAVRLAASLLEAAEADVVCVEGALSVRGVPARSVSWAEVATAAELAAAAARPEDDEDDERQPGLGARCGFEQSDATYTFTAHLSVVEVDPETGVVTPVEHHAVTDCGRVVDPPGATGQVVGATVQGIAQALWEELVHVDGVPVNASLAEYGFPSAVEVPPITATFVTTPTSRNPLGARGVGEVGMVAAPVATYNAVVDALAPLGVRAVELPCTPERVWRAVTAASPVPSGGHR
jgi:carbon-monoxide dehydrogenase large subunit